MNISKCKRRFNFLIVLSFFFSFSVLSQTIKVFVLAGQSNAQGHGDINPPSTPGTLSNFVDNDSLNEFNGVHDGLGGWITRSDVWVRYDHESDGLLAGNLNVGYGGYSGQIGPELGMGHRLGDFYDEKILIIKTCWGGKNLAVDFRPPSSGGVTGVYYSQMIADITTAINSISTEFPSYNGETIELSGFVWFQGWNDGEQLSYLNEYEQNLTNLISDVRTDLGSPNLPFVVGLTGIGGYTIDPVDAWVQDLQTILVPAQINAASDPSIDNLCFAETRWFWKDFSVSPVEAVHHWNNNAESYLRIGDAFGVKLIQLIDNVIVSQEELSSENTPSAFPVPFHNNLQLNHQNRLLSVTITDISGKEVLKFDNTKSGVNFDVSGIPKGLYLINFFDEQGTFISTQKIVKQ